MLPMNRNMLLAGKLRGSLSPEAQAAAIADLATRGAGEISAAFAWSAVMEHV